MRYIQFMAASLLTAVNDTVAEVEDLSKLAYSELKDRFTTLNTGMEEIEGKYADKETKNWTPEDVTAYKKHLTDLDLVSTARNEHPDELVNRRSAYNVLPNATALNDTLQNLQSRIIVGADNSIQDPKAGFKDDREFLTSVTNFYRDKSSIDPRLAAHVENAIGADEYSRSDWQSAGVLIPDGFLNTLIRTTPEEDQLLGRMTDIPMSAPTIKIPAMVDKNHRESFTGGTRVFRTSETETVEKTKDKFEMISMEAAELIGESAATKMLMRYSPISIAAMIQSSLKIATNYKQRDEIIVGDGKGKYLGFLNPANGALISITRGPGLVPDTEIINGIDILRMRQRMFGYEDAVWVFNWDLFVIVSQLHIESPNAAGLIKLYAPPQGDVPDSLLGRPIVWTEFMPGISQNDGTDIGDWGEAGTGGNFAACVSMSNYFHSTLYTEEAQSVHVRFSEREEVFQWVLADDARPSWLTTLTPKRGITTRSPFVALNNTSVAS